MNKTYITNPKVEDYCAVYTSSLPDYIQQVWQQTVDTHADAHMISGPLQGEFLKMMAQALQAKKVLEIGTFTGFSALCFAAGMPDDGVVYTIELRDAEVKTAQANFDVSPQKNKIKLLQGDAKKIIPTLTDVFDLVFIDADKTGYIDYYDLSLPKLKKGGSILADNVLFHGTVLEEPVTGKNATAIQAFNNYTSADDQTEKIMLPLRDGLSWFIKK